MTALPDDLAATGRVVSRTNPATPSITLGQGAEAVRSDLPMPPDRSTRPVDVTLRAVFSPLVDTLRRFIVGIFRRPPRMLVQRQAVLSARIYAPEGVWSGMRERLARFGITDVVFHYPRGTGIRCEVTAFVVFDEAGGGGW